MKRTCLAAIGLVSLLLIAGSTAASAASDVHIMFLMTDWSNCYRSSSSQANETDRGWACSIKKAPE